MKDLLLTLLHLAVTAAKLCRPGGVRAVIAENLLLKQQLIAAHTPARGGVPHEMPESQGLRFEHSLQVTAGPVQVLAAFFDPDALSAWWRTVRSVTTPRPLGIYAIEWESTPFQDEVLGSLGGVFYGTVMEFRNGREFFLADAYWMPPEGPPLGPMALEVSCRVEGPGTRLRVRQSGAETHPRWQRYYDLIAGGWEESLEALKQYLEQGGEPRLPNRGRVR